MVGNCGDNRSLHKEAAGGDGERWKTNKLVRSIFSVNFY